MRTWWKLTIFMMIGVLVGLGTWAWATEPAKEMDRTILPIREPEYPAITEIDARRAKAPPRFEVNAPKGAPNVVIVLIDDFGLGQASAFGGPIQTPTMEQL